MSSDLLSQMPKMMQSIFGSPITTGGLAAIVLSLLLPAPRTQADEGHTAANETAATVTASNEGSLESSSSANLLR